MAITVELDFHIICRTVKHIFNLRLETGWPITAHSVGLGDVPAEHLQTTGRPVPGYNGIFKLSYS